MSLRVEVGRVSNDPPTIFVRMDIPNFVCITQYLFGLHTLHVQHSFFATSLAFDIVCNVSLGVEVSFRTVSAKLVGR
jgi:hypothetical protein